MKQNKLSCPEKLVLGITGTIASGKSTLCRYIRERYGALHIDADLVARRVVEDMAGELSDQFGQNILTPEGQVDRKALGAVVFNDPDKLALLNGLVHPETCRRIREQIEVSDRPLILVEAIELLRSDLKNMIHKVMVVYAEPALRSRRMMETRGLTEEEAESRIRSQLDDQTYRDQADYVIHSTDAPFEVMQTVCDEILSGLIPESPMRDTVMPIEDARQDDREEI
ncbi:MAG: dephospho-CoA kinase [Lachnospiraceae bacterium]|nr:dephospho-CoA kinase [Lachnospiraceae bacterium]